MPTADGYEQFFYIGTLYKVWFIQDSGLFRVQFIQVFQHHVDICGIDDHHCLNCLFTIHGITLHITQVFYFHLFCCWQSPLMLLEPRLTKENKTVPCQHLYIGYKLSITVSWACPYTSMVKVGIRRRSMTLYSRPTTHPVI